MSEITTIDDVNEGDFVKYSDKDKRGRFSYTGEVLSVDYKSETFEMLTMDGEMGFCLKVPDPSEETTKVGQYKNMSKDDDPNKFFKLEIIKTKPKGWAKFKKNPEEFKKSNTEVPEVVVIKTQKQKVFDLVKANPRKKLRGLLTLAKKEIGGDEGKLKLQIQLAISKYR